MPTDTLDFAMNFESNEQAEADKKLFVVFYQDVIKNEPKSAEAGRPIFDTIDLIKIMTPGSRDTVVSDATEQYQSRFPQQWARYKAGKEQNTSGTPLNQLSWLSIAQIAEYNAVGCHTIEQLAGMADAMAQRFMGHHAIKLRAQQYLDAASGSAPILLLQDELRKRDEQLAELRSTVEALQAAEAQRKAEKAAQVPQQTATPTLIPAAKT
jgi:hypothetical protein